MEFGNLRSTHVSQEITGEVLWGRGGGGMVGLPPWLCDEPNTDEAWLGFAGWHTSVAASAAASSAQHPLKEDKWSIGSHPDAPQAPACTITP